MTSFFTRALQALIDEQTDDLNNLIEEAAEAGGFSGTNNDDCPLVEGVTSYQDAGVLTSDEGFVVKMSDGAEYQITVVRSK